MSRQIARIVTANRVVEGEGFVVQRAFPVRELADFDPFMLFDHFGPVELGPGEAKGAPDHPHRGFETVSYLLSGEMEHLDSWGNRGKMGPGDVQWMTAGSGVVHSEMPAPRFLREGGVLHGFQIWVNLPKKDKRAEPHYQEIASSQIPVGTSEDGRATVKVIAGEALGRRARIQTRTPLLFLHWQLQPGARIVQPVPREFNAMAYVISGRGAFSNGGTNVVEGQAAMFDRDGDDVLLSNPEGAGTLDVLLLGGTPLAEPVARWGPFVMNTEAEIAEAMRDFRAGRMGTIAH